MSFWKTGVPLVRFGNYENSSGYTLGRALDTQTISAPASCGDQSIAPKNSVMGFERRV